jgi:hypothetical protein
MSAPCVGRGDGTTRVYDVAVNILVKKRGGKNDCVFGTHTTPCTYIEGAKIGNIMWMNDLRLHLEMLAQA